MQQTLTAGTDAASVVVFDPAALPNNFEEKYPDDPISQLEQLSQAGRLFWLDTHADGEYLLGVYIGESLPSALQPFAKSLKLFDQFHVPSGRLFFTGMEYAFRTNDNALRKHPHMGEAADIPPGQY